jgi:hypothetical protein
MKPLQIGLLVLVGALGGALIMKFTQRSKPAPAPIVSAVPTPAEPATVPADTPAPAETAAGSVGTPEPKPTAVQEKTPPATVVKMAHHTQPMLRTPTAAATVAHNLPPAQPEAPAPAPVPMQEPSAPPISTEPDPVPVATPAPAMEAEPPAQQPAPSVTLQSGMMLPVRLGESLSSEHNQAGDTFTATLDAALSADGFVIAEKGAHVEGRVVEAQKSGHVKGKATLALELTKLNTSDGQHVDIKTETLRKQGTSMATGDQVGIVAAAAGVGAIIGAIAGGGKGAAIGAGAGGAAGGGGVVATRDKAVSLPTESKITFRLSAPVTVTERLNK